MSNDCGMKGIATSETGHCVCRNAHAGQKSENFSFFFQNFLKIRSAFKLYCYHKNYLKKINNKLFNKNLF